MRNNRFNHGRSTFTCSTCGRLTRLSGQGQDSECCFECWELAGYQNSVWDNGNLGGADGTVLELLRTIERRGGDVARVRADFKDLFDVVDETQAPPVAPVNHRGARPYEGSFAQKCDVASFAGGTIEEIAAAAGTKVSVIRGHFKFRTAKGKYVVVQDGDHFHLEVAQ